ncbi:MAG: hypothetical protein FWD26_06135 [Treponema sp.]|nr:hypothetical protein [Treponema sp.]
MGRKKKPIGWLLVFSLIISLASLVVYLAEKGFSDDILFILLAILKYSSLLLFICSLYKLLKNIYYFFKKPSVKCVLKVIIFIILIVYCAGIFYFEAFINVVSGGNG